MIMFCDLTSAQYEDYINSITELLISRNHMVIQSFISTLKVVPHGIVVLNQQDQEISYVNEETAKIFHESDSSKIKCRLRNFKHKSLTIQEESHDSFESISIQDLACPPLIKIDDDQQANNQNLYDSDKQSARRDKINLLEYLQRKQRYQIHDQNDHLFKDVSNKQYILVKCTPINAKTQLLVCFNDISKLKYLEKTSKKIKSMFFSSIAHELRTPLNSIIPISKQLRQQFVNDQEVRFYLDIIINSSHHLENVIEDALDMSRIENNKFEINMTSFDLRQTIQEIKEIMEFQAKQKELNLKIDISNMVPSQIITDKKRYRQNAMLVTQVTDTGIGISSEDIKKLFVFFGKVDCQKSINQSGMGLGLTISKMIVEQLHESLFTREDSVFDCNIEDEDEQDQLSLKIGSQYLADKGIKNMSNVRNDIIMNPVKVFNVLLVDDSPYNLIVLKELLKKIEVKMEIQKAMNGQMALTTVQKIREMEEQGIINISNTKVIGFSALTYRQFQENPNSDLFDQFSKIFKNYKQTFSRKTN
ncbi:multi-sensor hybrid histidine kinase [Stylonychia lemnae]|uniref:histidine kinase n=1 Tax=Stylonychia lemnae TaxID=5949 RepID=A0A078A4B9_STYLE|nr:multi-sensor hybrid histidine kinase [Stylonychia lemnae]|eukprot:CDW76333.1 multi-sensor hybrid histidine kinase [Stylonychia lemnae]